MPGTVTDLNGTGIGGVPALFKAFTTEAGLNYSVSLETHPGVGLDWHYNNELSVINKPWDQVVLQSYSTLDATHPGDPTTLIKYAGLLASDLNAMNPKVDIHLAATWTRADKTYVDTTSPWYGKPIDAMEKDVYAGYVQAKQASPFIQDVVPIGGAWNTAIVDGIADPNPYDGITPGQIDLWAPEGYHASVYGYYLEALMDFGTVTALDPTIIGAGDYAAADLGISPTLALELQRVAEFQLATVDELPEPSSLIVLGSGVAWLAARRRRTATRG